MAVAREQVPGDSYPIGNNVAGEGGREVVLAAIYARTSSPNQRFNYSIEEQVRLCRERCDIMGWKVRYIFKDEAVSGSNTDRPKFQLMLERAMAGAFDVIVFWKLDRFCRSLVDLINVQRELSRWGIGLHSVTEQVDTTTPVGRFNFRNLASAAELERDLISERARMGMHALAKQHKWPSNIPPLGYDRKKDGRLEVNRREAKLVVRIFKLYLETKSMAQTAFILNREGVRTKRGNRWTISSIKNVLDYRLYLGEYNVAGVVEHVEDYQIVSKELFEKVHELRERYKHEARKMPDDMKTATIERIFGDYLNYLDGTREEGFKIV
jgi:site-specific DNA recombinase